MADALKSLNAVVCPPATMPGKGREGSHGGLDQRSQAPKVSRGEWQWLG